MRRPAQPGASPAGGRALRVTGVALVAFFAGYVLLQGPEAQRSGARGVAGLAPVITAPDARPRAGVPALPPAAMPGRPTALTDPREESPGLEVRSPDVGTLPPAAAPARPLAGDDAGDPFAELDGSAGSEVRAPIERAPKPARHDVLTTRLGWAPGDARRHVLAAWLARAHDEPAAELATLVGPADAAAIAGDLAEVPVHDER